VIFYGKKKYEKKPAIKMIPLLLLLLLMIIILLNVNGILIDDFQDLREQNDSQTHL
jgi:hypothetical protein